MAASTIKLPLDLVRLSLDERVVIRLKGDRELRGKLHVRFAQVQKRISKKPLFFFTRRAPPYSTPTQAFDEHINMVLGDCEETHITEEQDVETGETIVKRHTRQLGMLFVRGDIVVHVSPPLRTS